jgi:hypothetical protein
MAAMTGRIGILLVIALAVLAGSGVPAWAHTATDTAPIVNVADTSPIALWQASAPAAGVPWTVVILVLALGAISARRPRRALALTVVLLLAFFAFENGVHSVHHLNDRAAKTTCAVASATTHIAGTATAAASADAIILSSLERLVPDNRPDVVVRSLAAHQGRAPPLAA